MPLVGELSADARGTIGATAAGMDRPNAVFEPRIRACPRRRGPPAPGVVPARGDTEDAGQGGNGKLGLVRTHEPEDFPGTVSRVNQAAAFAKMARSSCDLGLALTLVDLKRPARSWGEGRSPRQGRIPGRRTAASFRTRV